MQTPSPSPFPSHYMPNTESDRAEMLRVIGLSSVDELFTDIPERHRNPPLDIPPPLSELELRSELANLADKNVHAGTQGWFLGSGVYNHFVPSIVKPIITRGEFLTSYTPYQAEASQGTLQYAYEFQTLICNLMGMDVANDGMYEGASSLAEAALMSCRITQREDIYVLDTVSPTYRRVLKSYAEPQGLNIHTLSATNTRLPDGAACLIVQYPNFFGYIEDLASYQIQTQNAGAMFVVSADPVAMGLFKSPGEYGADIVTGEGQGIGVPMSYGGPYVGLFCTRSQFVRQMPGRLVGRTVDQDGEIGYVLTLQTREQHIRRERATSNICTSQALLALATTITLAALGRQGLRHVAELCYHKSHYAASIISNIPGYSLPLSGVFFKEMVVQCPENPDIVNERLLEKGIVGGLNISDQIPNCMLLCVTEMNSRQQIDDMTNVLREFSQ
ncbi:aminomethyl-transferring glycine dehydrogenase subunit GcvPA [SAR202 cluster bacterium AD-804-J14_MRT_500m]|nr:aminomethyl-transferring glycine dehydrogenase subunit GcvPA [SAR202 cluster bacterium AD-804-J14_MRT_500m]